MIEHIFPTPVYCNVLKDSEVLNYHIDRVMDKVDFQYKKEWGGTHYISTDFKKGSNVIKVLGLHKVKKAIDDNLRVYCDELNFPMREYTMHSWFSKFEKGNYAHIHHHGNADISGAYYYKTNGEDGKFWFECPNPHLSTSECYYSNWSKRWEYKPREGKMLLFPGWLNHGVETNNTDNTRISLAFNIYFKDK